MALLDPWYQELAEKYGEEFCRIAGYFDETKPFGEMYSDIVNLPQDDVVIQFSGAFHPFHEGHLSIVKDAVEHVMNFTSRDRYTGERLPPHVVIHADHSEYRHSKGHYEEEAFLKSFDILNGHNFKWTLVKEDDMQNGCSRNFTRLYAELMNFNQRVYFLSGGDRANYALSFIDNGFCIIAGREQHPMYKKYSKTFLCENLGIEFLSGNHPASSTKIREQQ